jgi:chromosome segregation ATPase
VITQKIEADADAVKLRADMEKARRERDRIGGELNGLRNWLMQPGEIIAAEQAVTQTQADFTKAVEAAVAADAEVQKLTAVVTKLAPQRKELDAKVKAAREKAEKSEESLALKKTLDDADKAAEEKRVAHAKLVEGKMAADADAVKLADDLKAAKEAPARQEIEAKIKAILAKVNESEDVKAAKTARDEVFAPRDLARKAYQEKLTALFTADTTAVEADGNLRELGQAEGQLQKLRRDIEQGEAVKALREALAAARTKLAETRASVTEQAQAAVATTDEGAKLVKEKAELDAKIKALTTP